MSFTYKQWQDINAQEEMSNVVDTAKLLEEELNQALRPDDKSEEIEFE